MTDEMENKKRECFKKIVDHVFVEYHKKIDEILRSENGSKLLGGEVIVLIMNIVVNVSTTIYFSLKDYVLNVPLDYEFMKRTILNNLSDSFDKITNYKGSYQKIDDSNIQKGTDDGSSTHQDTQASS